MREQLKGDARLKEDEAKPSATQDSSGSVSSDCDSVDEADSKGSSWTADAKERLGARLEDNTGITTEDNGCSHVTNGCSHATTEVKDTSIQTLSELKLT